MAGSIWQVNTAIKALFTSPLEYKCEIYVCILYIVNSDVDADEKTLMTDCRFRGSALHAGGRPITAKCA